MGLLQLLKSKNIPKENVDENSLESNTSLADGLVYAVTYRDEISSIFLYIDGKNDILLGDRWHRVSSLCFHSNRLLDGGYKPAQSYPKGFVIETIPGEDIVSRENIVFSLCSHNGTLYRGGVDGVYEVFSGKKVASRSTWVTTLCSHKGVLYDAGSYFGVFDTFRNKKISKKRITELCSHGDSLYGLHEIFGLFGGWAVFDISKNKKKTMSNEPVISLGSYEGRLYCGTVGYLKVYAEGIVDDKIFLLSSSRTGIVTALCSVPPEFIREVKHSYYSEFNPIELQQTNPEEFIEYFRVNKEKKKVEILNKLFHHSAVNESVIAWLNKNERALMRKASFLK